MESGRRRWADRVSGGEGTVVWADSDYSLLNPPPPPGVWPLGAPGSLPGSSDPGRPRARAPLQIPSPWSWAGDPLTPRQVSPKGALSF